MVWTHLLPILEGGDAGDSKNNVSGGDDGDHDAGGNKNNVSDDSTNVTNGSAVNKEVVTTREAIEIRANKQHVKT